MMYENFESRNRPRALRTVLLCCSLVAAVLAVVVWPFGAPGASSHQRAHSALRDAAVSLAIALEHEPADREQLAFLRSLVELALDEPTDAARQWAPVLLPALRHPGSRRLRQALLAHLDPQSGAAYAARLARARAPTTARPSRLGTFLCRRRDVDPSLSGHELRRQVLRHRVERAVRERAIHRPTVQPEQYVGPPLPFVSR